MLRSLQGPLFCYRVIEKTSVISLQISQKDQIGSRHVCVFYFYFFYFTLKDEELTGSVVRLFSKIERLTLGKQTTDRGNSGGHAAISVRKES